MLAMLFANRIINKYPDFTMADVPNMLKPQVREILIEAGMGHLAE